MSGRLIFFGTGATLVAYSDDTFERCVDAASLPGGQPVGTINAISMSPDGSKLAVGHSTTPFLTVYDTATWQKITITGGAPDGLVRDLTWNPSGTLLATAHATSNFLTVYSVSDWSKVSLAGGKPAGSGYGVSFSPDGTKLAHTSGTSPFLTVYETTGWTKLTITGGQPSGAGQCKFSPDGVFLAAGGSSGLTVYTVTDWAKVTLSGGAATKTTNYVAFSPDSAQLAATIGASPYMYIYDTATWTYTDPIAMPGGSRGVSYNDDGTKLVLALSGATGVVIVNPTTWSSFSIPIQTSSTNAPCPTTLSTRWLTTGAQSIRDEAGSPASGRAVRAYNRATGAFLAEVTTDASGKFAIPFVSEMQTQVAILDDDAGEQYNDLIFGRVIPATTP